MDKRNEIHEAQREAASSEREERKENQVMVSHVCLETIFQINFLGN